MSNIAVIECTLDKTGSEQCQADNPRQQLRLMTVANDAMSPTFERGDIAIVDTLQRRFMKDGIYVIEAHGMACIKQLTRRINGSIVVSDANPVIKTFDVVESDESLEVIGKVVGKATFF